MRTSPKLKLFKSLADLARALGNAHRLDLLEHLAQGERRVDALAAKAGITVANASQHLQALRREGLITGERRGTQIIYRLSGDDVLDLLAALRCVAGRHSASARQTLDDYFLARDKLEPVSIPDLMQRVQDGLVTVIDVRPADEFALGHVPGALNVPLKELESRLTEIPANAEIIAYCRGPWCVLSFEAVAILRQKGRTARRLDGGLPEWKRAGLQVDAIA